MTSLREPNIPALHPAAACGIEFIEYATSAPQALGHVLELMGFRPVARHRSREITRYRQGTMNIVVNAQPGVVIGGAALNEHPTISAIALHVRDAPAAHAWLLEHGGWEVPMHGRAMELNIPGIHGPAGAHVYFVDRQRDFSIFDIDFTPIPTVDPQVPAIAGMRFFGVVQYVGLGRTNDWCEFYGGLMAFRVLDEEERFGILPRGTLLASPGGEFLIQLVEPDPATMLYDEDELFHHIGIGAPDVPAAVAALQQRGVEFVPPKSPEAAQRGALTRTYSHSLMFELVHDERATPAGAQR